MAPPLSVSLPLPPPPSLPPSLPLSPSPSPPLPTPLRQRPITPAGRGSLSAPRSGPAAFSASLRISSGSRVSSAPVGVGGFGRLCLRVHIQLHNTHTPHTHTHTHTRAHANSVCTPYAQVYIWRARSPQGGHLNKQRQENLQNTPLLYFNDEQTHPQSFAGSPKPRRVRALWAGGGLPGRAPPAAAASARRPAVTGRIQRSVW